MKNEPQGKENSNSCFSSTPGFWTFSVWIFIWRHWKSDFMVLIPIWSTLRSEYGPDLVPLNLHFFGLGGYFFFISCLIIPFLLLGRNEIFMTTFSMIVCFFQAETLLELEHLYGLWSASGRYGMVLKMEMETRNWVRQHHFDSDDGERRGSCWNSKTYCLIFL